MINRSLRSKEPKGLRLVLVVFFSLIIPVIASCSGQKKQDVAVITVNGAPVTLQEFQKELALYASRNPDFKLTPGSVDERINMLIDKQLMIQEATKMGLTEDERFLDTIKRFWEQTLIRELIEAKGREWRDKIFVTEDEIHSHYMEMTSGIKPKPPLQDVHDEIKSFLLEQKRQKALDEWLKDVRKGASIKIDAKSLAESYK